MPVARDYTVSVEPMLRPLLRDGERLLAASPLVHDPGSTEDLSIADELKNLLDPTMLLGLGAHPGGLLRQATFGRALVGGSGSTAKAVFDIVTPGSGAGLAVTDARMLLYATKVSDQPGAGFWRRWFGSAELSAELLYEVGRDRIAGAVAAPAGLLRRGRILLLCRDGSACALVCSGPDSAARAVAAIGPPVSGPPISGPPVSGRPDDDSTGEARP